MIRNKRISILLLMFIFGLVIEVQAEPVKSFKIAAFRENIIKINENEVIMKTTTKSFQDWGSKGIKFLFSEFGQSILNPYPDTIKDFKNRGGLPTLKLLKSKRTEVFMLFRLSFDPKEGFLFFEVNL